MQKKTKLNKEERFEIDYLYNTKKLPLREIARLINRNVSTVSREIKRNRMPKAGIYEAKTANNKARNRKRMSKFQWQKIERNEQLRQYIIKGFKNHWNPDEISGRMRYDREPFYISKTTIYDWLRSSNGQRYCKYLYSRRYYSKKRKKKAKKILIPDRIGIELRLKGANNRSRYGHFEADTIVSGKRGKGAITVLYERKTRYFQARKLNKLKENIKALKRLIRLFKIRSITFDNGFENIRHKELNLSTFFCDPYSAWQKGGIENINKMIRRYIPKGSNISKYSDRYLEKIVEKINKKPRRCLGYKSAYEAALEKGVIINNKRCD